MNSKMNILVVEDEATIRTSLKLNLELEGYQVSDVKDGIDALKLVKQEHFDLIVLDIMLPELDGISVCQAIRVNNNRVPILFLSAKNTSEDRILGLKIGGDDYLTKPFDLEEFLLRVKILLDKSKLIQIKSKDITTVISFSNNHIDFNKLEVKNFNGEVFKVSKREAMLLRLLIDHADQVLSREHILQVVWGYSVFPNTRTIDNFILSFRKYFEKDHRNLKHFHSIRGVGYKFTY